MPDPSKIDTPRPKPENLFVALLPSWSRTRALAIMKKSNSSAPLLLHLRRLPTNFFALLSHRRNA
jgi:hypothetical protein